MKMQRSRLSSDQLALIRTQIHRDRALPIVWPMRQPDVFAVACELVGRRFGRLTVMGLSAVPTTDSGHQGRWVVRCDCGAYEVRKRRALLNPNASLMCDVCDQREREAQGYHRGL